ncbi:MULTISPECIES: hypothetical protein [unclassified Chryseobacterium]|uniref:hypothetical protein n=1 Tax=unclassified Chryseobacterium TaxID=2593645 RepID=UPI00301AB050
MKNFDFLKTQVSLFDPFNVELIEQIEVFNYSTKTFTKCEYWGCNEEGENGYPYHNFGIIGDFDFEIYKDKVRFYYGDHPEYGVKDWDDPELIFLPRGAAPIPEGFLIFGYFDLEHTYDSSPQTFYDMIKLICNFYGRIEQHIEYLQNRKTNTF